MNLVRDFTKLSFSTLFCSILTPSWAEKPQFVFVWHQYVISYCVSIGWSVEAAVKLWDARPRFMIFGPWRFRAKTRRHSHVSRWLSFIWEAENRSACSRLSSCNASAPCGGSHSSFLKGPRDNRWPTPHKKQEPSARRNWSGLDGLDGGSWWLPGWRKAQVEINLNLMCRSPCKGKRLKKTKEKWGNMFWKKNDAEVSHEAPHTTAAAFDHGRCSCQPASAATHRRLI